MVTLLDWKRLFAYDDPVNIMLRGQSAAITAINARLVAKYYINHYAYALAVIIIQ